MSWITNKKLKVLFLVFLFAFAIFSGIIILRIQTDIQGHIRLLEKFLHYNAIPSTPLYYLTVLLFAFFINNTVVLLCAAILILSLAVTLKFFTIIKVWEFINGSQNKGYQEFSSDNAGRGISGYLIDYQNSILLGLLVISPLAFFESQKYLGKIAINIWHNSTTIFVLPFAILLYLYSIQYFKAPLRKYLFYIFILSVVNILSKPSFFFPFAMAFPLTCLILFKFTKPFWMATLTVFLSCIVLGAVFFYTYINSDLDQIIYGGTKTQLILAPFKVWSLYTNTIVKDYILSSIFPLVFIISFFNKIKKEPVVIYTMALYIIGLLFFILLAETGERLVHANFIWQAIICNFLLFMICLLFFLKYSIQENEITKRHLLVGFCYFLHILAGADYLLTIFTDKVYV